MSVHAQARLLLITVAVILGLCSSELLLRVGGAGPWRTFEDLSQVPVMTEADPEVGWVNRPGTYRYAPSRAASHEVLVRIDPAGRRMAPVTTEGSGPRVGLYGGSFLYGFGLDEADTVGAQLASRWREAQVYNAAVPGYGTLQSRILSRREPPPDVLVYGLNQLHDGRNAGARAWLHTLDRAGSHHPWRGVPWAVWDGQTLHEHGPAKWQHWAASEWSAVVHLLERASLNLRDRTLNTKTETTVQLVLRWQEEVRPARFVVALLDAPTRHRAYLRRFAEEGVEVIDLRGHGYPDEVVPGDGHPAASVHQRWAVTLAQALR